MENNLPPQPVQPEPLVQTTPPADNKPNVKRLRLIILGIVVLLLVTGIPIGVMLLGKKAPEPVQKMAVSTPTPTTNPTANWKVYTDTLNGFTIKYPSDKLVNCNREYSIKEGLNLWTAPFDCGPGDALYEVSVRVVKQAEYKQYKTPTSTKKISVDGVEATENRYVYTEEDGPLGGSESTEVLIPSKNSYIQIQLIGLGSEKQDRFTKILSTFKFLDQSAADTANWKTFTSSKLGFTMKYPSEWFAPQESSSGITFSKEEDAKTSFGDFLIVNNLNAFGENQNDLKIFNDIYASSNSTNVASYFKNTASGAVITKTGNLKVNNLPAVKVFEKPGPEFPAPFYAMKVFINGGDTIWTVSNIGTTEQEAVDREKIFDQILSTFKFTQ